MANTASPQTEAARLDWRRLAASPWTMAVAVAALFAVILGVSLQRTFLGTGVEADFSSIFAQETLRLFRGEPLQLPYHPPGFPFVLALGRLIGDVSWLTTGLWITGLSAVVVVAASVFTWRRLAGNAAAWGAIAALACSIPFRVSASVASSDMFFTALVCVLLLAIVAALQSPRRTALWAACGAAAAFVFLTRTNGLVAALVLALPFFVPAQDGNRNRNLASVALAFLLPIAVWSLVAQATGAPFLPVKNHLNLAVAVYGDGVGKWGEQMNRLRESMHSMTDVVMFDPARFVKTIARNLLTLPYEAAKSLTWLPITALAVPGIALMLWKRRTPALLACLAILAGMTLLSGTVGYVSRFFLMLIPVIGAMAGVALAAGLDRLALRDGPRAVAAATALLAAAAWATWISPQVFPRIEIGVQPEFVEAAPQLRQLTEPNAELVSRSSSLALETGRTNHYMPSATTAPALLDALCEERDHERLSHGRLASDVQPAYLYVGALERMYRGELVQDLAAHPVPWLEPVARGMTTDWTLYRVLIGQSNAASCSSSSAT